MRGVLCGTGSAVPDGILDNYDMAELVDTNDAWIQERTGIRTRHIAGRETTVSLAAEAARRALSDAGMRVEEVDLILVSTISSNVVLPCAACEVQKAIGADGAVCFDLNAACSGFLLAYNTASAYLTAGICRTALIIGSECLSNLTDWTDRGTCILFGDGAGAAVMRAAEGRSYLPVAHSDGTRGMALTCESPYDGWQKQAVTQILDRKEDQQTEQPPQSGEDTKNTDKPGSSALMQMDGQAVFKFAVRSVPEAIEQVLAVNQVAREEISFYVLHQANRRIVEAVARRLGEPMEKFPMNLQVYGNTSSASIPILLDEMRRDHRLKKGQKIVLAGFGAGLTWGASIVDWSL